MLNEHHANEHHANEHHANSISCRTEPYDGQVLKSGVWMLGIGVISMYNFCLVCLLEDSALLHGTLK
jgi:hypothetical protein